MLKTVAIGKIGEAARLGLNLFARLVFVMKTKCINTLEGEMQLQNLREKVFDLI